MIECKRHILAVSNHHNPSHQALQIQMQAELDITESVKLGTQPNKAFGENKYFLYPFRPSKKGIPSIWYCTHYLRAKGGVGVCSAQLSGSFDYGAKMSHCGRNCLDNFSRFSFVIHLSVDPWVEEAASAKHGVLFDFDFKWNLHMPPCSDKQRGPGHRLTYIACGLHL